MKKSFPMAFSVRSRRMTRGFTLIELLIVIAIILILIAIALPNFLEAQIRARVTKVNAELRSLETAMEAYFQDFRYYPTDHDNNDSSQNGMFQLSSPIRYIDPVPIDPFNSDVSTTTSGDLELGHYEMGSSAGNPAQHSFAGGPNTGPFAYRNNILTYVIISYGPDGTDTFSDNDQWPWGGSSNQCPNGMGSVNYSPTNGTKSIGDIFKRGGSFKAGRYCIDRWMDVAGPGQSPKL